MADPGPLYRPRGQNVGAAPSWQSAEPHCPTGLDDHFAFAPVRLRRRQRRHARGERSDLDAHASSGTYRRRGMAYRSGEAWARHREFKARWDRIGVSRPHASAVVADNDAPLIAERAATRGRIAR
jgi:hypothetical protein